jgi:hypothetical protein
MNKEPALDSSRRVIAEITQERRADPFDEETAQLQSEPAKFRLRAHRRHGWSDDQAQKEI